MDEALDTARGAVANLHDAVAQTAAKVDAAGAAGADHGTLLLLLFILALAIFLGFELINKVPSTLHTPLMSGSNAISGITLVGALVAAGSGAAHPRLSVVLGTLAVALAMTNVVGGYFVTDRMLAMFKPKTPSAKPGAGGPGGGSGAGGRGGAGGGA